MDASIFEKVSVAFTNVEDLLVEIMKRKDAATREDERKKLNDVETAADVAYQRLVDLRLAAKKNL